MKIQQMVPALGLLVMGAYAWAQTDGQNKGAFGSPDIYNTGKTGSKTLPPSDTKNQPVDLAEIPLRTMLQAIYNQCVAATKKRDESVLAGYRAQDFTYRDAKGKTYSRGDIEAGERQAFSNAVSIDKASSQVETVKESGGKTTATLHHYYAETTNDAQNKLHKITLNTTTQEVWTSVANVWKLQSVKVVSQQETLDGKPYAPSASNNANNQGNQNNGNNGNNGNRQANRKNANNNGYRAPRIRQPKIRTLGGTVNP